MSVISRAALLALTLAIVACGSRQRAQRTTSASIACPACDEWNAAREPFHIHGHTYYVGVRGLGSVLIASSRGLVVLDGGLPQSAARIDASIRKLGFRTRDIRLIVNSHAHFDHAGARAGLSDRRRSASSWLLARGADCNHEQAKEPPIWGQPWPCCLSNEWLVEPNRNSVIGCVVG